MPLHTLTLGESGSPVVFLHGLFGQGRNWNTIGKALAPEHRVTLVDLPHHGRSPHPDHFDYLEMSAAVAEVLAGEPATVVGHSMGGKVAMLLAITRPELVSRLVVADMSPVTYERASEFSVYVDALGSLDLASITRRDEADAALREKVPDPTIRGFLLQNLRRSGAESDGALGWRWAMNLDVLGRDLAAIGEWPADRIAGLPAYEGPVLWLGGERSGYVTDEYAGAMRAWFPHYRRVTIKNAGHWIHSERPEVFLSVLRQFLGD
ncbi:MAG: alpha/beta fold hydrolase [Nocardioides sp.]|nr:alpha/beta fold hydrolase [Nocardioides sp.]